MVKPKTGRQNFYRELMNHYHTPDYYQQYLGVEYLTTRQIDEYLNKQKLRPPKNEKELEIIYQKINKVYPRIIYNKKLLRPIHITIKKAVPEVVTLD
jgi:hypothetical protein